MVRDSCSCQKARFSLAENELTLRTQCGNAACMIGMEMCEKYRPRVNIQTGELRRQIFAWLLAVGHAIDPIKELHSLCVIAVGRMFREGVVEARVNEEVSEARMMDPMNQNSKISRQMIALCLLGAGRIQIQTSVHVDNTGLKGNQGNITRISQHIVPVCERGGRNLIGCN